MKPGSEQVPPQYLQSVLDWYRLHGRHQLPWQIDKTAYRVWLSEIMLQQTQVATVIPYYRRFLKRFPDVSSLASASIDEVLRHWQGLGYYARARNLHRAAQIIRDDYNGEFPQLFERVIALPGIGRSTAGAILSLACNQPWPILDGNVKRVLSRLFQVSGWYGTSQTMKNLWQIAERLTPPQNTGDYNQAMMDLGAMICLRTQPVCEACPVSQYCQSYQQDTQADYPQKKPTRPKPRKQTLMLLHRFKDRVLLYRRPPSGIWGGLWSLPEIDNSEAIAAWQSQHLALVKLPVEVKTNVLKHQFTHYSLDISLARIDLEQLPDRIDDDDSFAFIKLSEISDYGLPTPVRKLLNGDAPFNSS